MYSMSPGRKALNPGRTPWLATLLLAALAACGGNTGDGGTHPASGTESGTSPRGLQTKAPGDEATPATPAAGAAAAAAAPISANGVRGDVLAQALRTSTNQVEAGQSLPTRAWPATRNFPEGTADKQSKTSSFFTDQNISADEGKSGLGTHVSHHHAHAMPEQSTGKTLFTGVEWRVGLSGQGNLPADLAQGAADAEALQLGTQLPLTVRSDPQMRGDDMPVKSLTATAATPYSLRRNTLAAWNTPLHSWRADGDQNRVDLLVLKGATANQFAACFKFNVASYLQDRLHCSLWQVPANWAPGTPLVYQGQHVNHVRRDYDGSGIPLPETNIHWVSDPQAIHGKAESSPPTDPSPPNTPAKAEAPISIHGISGGVLATMLDAMSPRGNGAARLPPFAPAAEAEDPSFAMERDMFNDKPASQARAPLRVSLQQLARVTQYADGATSGGYAPAVGSYLYLQRSGAWRSADDPMRPIFPHAVQTLAVHVSNERQGDKGSVLLSRWLGLRQQTVTRTGEAVDDRAELRGLATPDAAEHARAGDPAGSKRYAHDELVRYGTVHEWRFNDRQAQVKLWLEAHEDTNRRRLDDQVRLCWEVNKQEPEPDLERNVCTVWQVPANWTYGQPLAPQSFHMIDSSLGPTRVEPYRQVWSSTVPATP
ncbi:MAG: hypothetical protein Q4E06_09345 [Lautropia sp.]|nr:hypothetical protein [Lautropia sp.]